MRRVKTFYTELCKHRHLTLHLDLTPGPIFTCPSYKYTYLFTLPLPCLDKVKKKKHEIIPTRTLTNFVTIPHSKTRLHIRTRLEHILTYIALHGQDKAKKKQQSISTSTLTNFVTVPHSTTRLHIRTRLEHIYLHCPSWPG